MVHFGEFLKTWSLRSNSVTRQVSFYRTKIGGKWQKSKFECDILSNFQTMWLHALQKKGGLKIRENIPFHESNKSRNNEVV